MKISKNPETAQEDAATGAPADSSATGEGVPPAPPVDSGEPEERAAPIAAIDGAGRERPIVGGSFTRAKDGTITRREV